MSGETTYQFGMIGVGVMGRNLAWNIADHGTTVAAWNREQDMMDEVLAAAPGKIHGTRTMAELVACLERPRRVMIMITAGKPVDMVLDALLPLLSPGDVVIDGGNSWFEDTRRREERLTALGMNFVGVGVSGGEDGARHGPSLMPGGKAEAYALIAPVLEAIAAKTESGACVTHVGPDGAGHFVKMVHNGIEYADMQLIAESYDVLKRVGGYEAPALAKTFHAWNGGALESFLIEITATIFGTADPRRAGGWLVDRVLDKAGQKGTGRWTAEVALRLGVSIPSIAAAIDARVLSSMKEARVKASEVLTGPRAPVVQDPGGLADVVRDALLAAKVGAYAQGMALIRAGSAEYGWDVDLREMARIWKGGCIIRAALLDTIMKAFEREPGLTNLLLDAEIRKLVEAGQGAWRKVVALAAEHGIPVPAMSAGLAYYDAFRTAALPQNLTQAQRDAFGAHTYQRSDAPEEGFVHTDWLG